MKKVEKCFHFRQPGQPASHSAKNQKCQTKHGGSGNDTRSQCEVNLARSYKTRLEGGVDDNLERQR